MSPKLWADIIIKGDLKHHSKAFKSDTALEDFIDGKYGLTVEWETLDFYQDRPEYELWNDDEMKGFVIIEHQEVF